MAEPVIARPGDAVRFGVLGPLLVVDGSGTAIVVPAPKQRIVMATLLLGSGDVVSADGLAEALWDGSQPPNAPTVLRTYVGRLRGVLGPVGARITRRPGGWAVDLRGPEEFDLATVDDLRRAAQEAALAGEWPAVSSLLTRALSLWRGEPLIDVPSGALARREDGRLAELRIRLTEARIDADLRLGRHGELVPELRQLAAEHPLREHIRAQLMLACYRCGHQAAALEVYRDAHRTLAEELGVEPGRELRDIHQKILTDDADLGWAARDDGVELGRWQPPVVPRQLPAAPGHFVGRRPELEWLAGLGGEAGGHAVGVISGMAGVGKTALALHWAQRVAGEFPDGQLYADLGGFGPSGSPAEPAAVLHGFLDGLGVPLERVPRELEARAGLYRSLVAGRRMVIVLDNARDAEQVRPLLPGSPGCLVLVTSRARLAGLAVGGTAGLVALEVLSEEEARELLAVRVGAGRVAGEAEAVRELTGLCARLPLAVAIAAARAVADPRLSLAALTAELRDAGGRLDGLDAGDAATSIRAVLSWSYEQLAELPARMLRLMAVHPGPGITAAAAASMAGISLGQARHALRVLGTASLITEYRPGRFGLHELVRACAAEQARAAGPAGSAGDLDAAIARMLDHYTHTATAADWLASQMTLWEHDPVTLAAARPGVSPERLATKDEALAWLDAEHAVLVNVTGQAAETGLDAEAWQLARCLPVFFRLRGHWHELVATQHIALDAARRQRDQRAQARAHLELGYALGQAGQFGPGHEHLEQALKLYHDLGDHGGEVGTRIAIGGILGCAGRDREALAATRAALPLAQEEGIVADHWAPGTLLATVLNNIGWFHARLGEPGPARTYCERALRLYRDAGSRYGEAMTLDSLACVQDQTGEHARAAASYRLASGLLRQLGALREAADMLIRLGDTCQAAADTAGARDAWQQASQILGGLRDPGTREVVAKLRQLDAS